ncbi:hypothetical protein P5673_017147 [Acropora cervicornis]|uniref:Uncharacterized protein n=1 Tax=Acropora cervicornis TaxID=6130 RepID=A0AAD9QF64_ACRCE|nr:hypothetical protein P5673_017147 [Acropora cervicornis]
MTGRTKILQNSNLFQTHGNLLAAALMMKGPWEHDPQEDTSCWFSLSLPAKGMQQAQDTLYASKRISSGEKSINPKTTNTLECSISKISIDFFPEGV